MTKNDYAGVIVRLEHCRKLRYCSSGLRAMCERHGLDYSDFLANGIPAEKLLAAAGEDVMVMDVLEIARG